MKTKSLSMFPFKLAWISLIASVFAFNSFGQKSKAGPSFDTADFSKKAELVDWLVRYDVVAWKTTDIVMTEAKSEVARLGAEWFCFQDRDNIWHAIYGKYWDGRYDLVFHYTMDSTGKISKLNTNPDQAFLNSHAQALITARSKLMTIIPSGSPRFNPYIRQNTDKTFDVWMFPAFQTNGMAVYGGEAVYHIDATGKNILADTSYFQPSFRGFETDPPREIWLNYREVEKPTLGSVFFVWYYKTYFTKIYIDNSNSTSTVIKDEKTGYIWVNIEKDPKKQNNPN